MALKSSVATRASAGQARDVSIRERTADHVFGSWRNLMVAYWIDRTTPSGVLRLNTHIGRLGEENTQRLGLVQIVSAKAPPPDSASRAALQTMLHGRGDLIACSSVVSPGSGFRAASVRAMITGLVMLARPKFPHVIHASIEETAQWHAQHLPIESSAVGASELLFVLHSIVRPT